MSRRSRQLKQDWQDLGRVDPLWAVLSRPEYHLRHGEALSSFFASGEAEVEHVLFLASRLGLPAGQRRCLDVGCGAGRVTRALARRFDECVGIDISESMVKLARELNRDVHNCSFVESEGEDLGSFESKSFDLVNASIVLQHLPDAQAIRRYIAEFMRVLTPQGVAIFQVPAAIPILHRLQPRARVFHLLRAVGVRPEVLYERAHLHPIHMRALPPAEVVAEVELDGGTVVLAESDVDAVRLRTPRYYVTPA